MTSSWVHSVSQLLALAALLAAFWIMLRVYRWHRRHMTKPSPYSKLIAEASDEKWSQRSNRIHTTISDHWPIVLVAITGLSLITNIEQLHREFHRQQFVELRDVRVLGRTDDFVFRMDVEDPDTHMRTPFMIRFCPDYKPTREIEAGVILNYLKYERHEMDNCSEIAPDSLGYTLRRDEHARPVRFDTTTN